MINCPTFLYESIKKNFSSLTSLSPRSYDIKNFSPRLFFLSFFFFFFFEKISVNLMCAADVFLLAIYKGSNNILTYPNGKKKRKEKRRLPLTFTYNIRLADLWL